MMNNFVLYKQFIGVVYGYNWWGVKATEVFGILFAMFWQPMDHQGTVCCGMFFESKSSDKYFDFDDCMEEADHKINPDWFK